MIVTNRGLKIYLPHNYCFALIARLYPKVDAFGVLEKTQAIYRIHSAAGFFTALICFLAGLSPIQIAGLTFFVTFGFYLLRLFGLFIFPGMVFVSTIYSSFTGYGLITLITLLIGLWRVGVSGTVAYVIARLFVEGLTIIFDQKAGTKMGIKMGMEPDIAKEGAMFYAPAIDFINAYKLYAQQFGKPIDVKVSDNELRIENWIHVWNDLVSKWPQVAQRFPKEVQAAS